MESPCAGSRPAFPPSERVSLLFNARQHNKNKRRGKATVAFPTPFKECLEMWLWLLFKVY